MVVLTSEYNSATIKMTMNGTTGSRVISMGSVCANDTVATFDVESYMLLLNA
jgi:hypothetical protein